MHSLLKNSLSRQARTPVSKVFLAPASVSFKANLSNKFDPITTPSPPKLPEEDQKEFERLQKIASSQAAIEEYNSQADAEADAEAAAPNLKETTDIGNFASYFPTIPEFEGDRNPKTGEVGGPKQDPLRHGDYSFNGRVTDF